MADSWAIWPVSERIGCRETGVYGRRYAGRIACSRRAWWLSEFVSVEINGLGNFLEQSRLYTLRALGLLKYFAERIHGNQAYTLRRLRGRSFGVIQGTASGARDKL
jgi:hypothetical protein